MRSRFSDIWQPIIDHDEAVARKEYLARGRAFAPMAAEALTQAWVAAFTAVAMGSDARIKETLDLGAELGLRGLGWPEHLVPADVMAALRKRIADSSPEEIEFLARRASRVWHHVQREAARSKSRHADSSRGFNRFADNKRRTLQ